MKPCCNSAVMAIDIRDEDIGIAVAYHRQHKSKKEGIKEFDICDTNTTSSTTSITPLPPLPYMSRDPHHPSYSFRHHHRGLIRAQNHHQSCFYSPSSVQEQNYDDWSDDWGVVVQAICGGSAKEGSPHAKGSTMTVTSSSLLEIR